MSPSASRAKPSRACDSGMVASITGRTPVTSRKLISRSSSARVPMVDPTTSNWRKNTRLRSAFGLGPLVAPETTSRPPGRSDRSECDQVASPTVSSTASTRSGNRAPASSARLPERVDAVLETVGEATWSHSLRSLRHGGRQVVSGATSGPNPKADLNRVFFLQLEVVGSTMGTRAELDRLINFLDVTGVRPVIDATMPLSQARDGFARLAEGDIFGKIVFTA